MNTKVPREESAIHDTVKARTMSTVNNTSSTGRDEGLEVDRRVQERKQGRREHGEHKCLR